MECSCLAFVHPKESHTGSWEKLPPSFIPGNTGSPTVGLPGSPQRQQSNLPLPSSPAWESVRSCRDVLAPWNYSTEGSHQTLAGPRNYYSISEEIALRISLLPSPNSLPVCSDREIPEPWEGRQTLPLHTPHLRTWLRVARALSPGVYQSLQLPICTKIICLRRETIFFFLWSPIQMFPA